MPQAPSAPTEKKSSLVVGAIDDNMVYPLLVWARSLTRTARTQPRCVIGFLEGSLSSHNQRFLESALNFLQIDWELKKLPFDERFITQGHISPTTFAKFLLADLIESPHLWIDVDTVATPRWDELFAIVAEAPKDVSLVVAERGSPADQPDKSAEPQSHRTFNAGVLGWPEGSRKPWSDRLDSMAIVETQEQQLFNHLYADSLETVPETYNLLTYRVDSLRDLSELPRIIHFAGAHKPWQLPPRFRTRCLIHECPWSLWFEAETAMLAEFTPRPLRKQVLQHRAKSLRSGVYRFRREHRGLGLLKILRLMGPFGWLVVTLFRPLRSFVPRGTHPLH
jgi:lipopolysaccharide biosynthesis glycosyltransferase